MLEERRMDFSPETYVWRCIHCASIADPEKDQKRRAVLGKHLVLAFVNRLH
jgi:hypothetical protein